MQHTLWQTFLKRSPRPLEILLGVFFLISAVMKAIDINLFSVQISYYGLIENLVLLDALAVAVVGLEALLGAALIAGWRMKGLLHAGVAALLLGFTGLVAYAWAFHGLAECGCLGRVAMTPPLTISKNAVLLALTFAVWAGLRQRPEVRSRLARGAVVVVALLTTAYAYSALEPATVAPTEGTQTDSPFAAFEIAGHGGEALRLDEGEFFVIVLSATCPHCRAAVPAVNDLMLEPGMPPTAALVYGEDAEITEFELMTEPFFPLRRITVRTFFGLIGSEPPRFYALRGGVSLKHWDVDIPTIEEIRAAFE